MRESTLLLLVVIAWLARKAYPEYGVWPFALPLGYLALGAYHWWTVTRLEKNREKAEKRAVAVQMQEYRRLRDALRDKYDPNNQWNEATSVPREFLEELRELNDQYRDAQRAWFGPEWDEDNDD